MDLASLKGRDPKEIAQNPAFRRTLAEHFRKSMARQTATTLRNILPAVGKDPIKALEQMGEISDSPTPDWVHIVSTWNGVPGTRALAAQIADVLASHRYRGMLPDLSNDSRWRAARLRRRIGAGLLMIVSLSAAVMVILHLMK